MSTYLDTDRLVLRQLVEADVAALVELDHDPEVRRFVEDGETVDAEYALALVREAQRWYGRSEVFGFWAAIERDSAGFLGWFHLRPHHGAPASEPELGYRLVRRSWGKGYATEGSRALIDAAFSSGTVERVVAETMAVNVGSRRVMEKCGMSLVREFHAEWPVRIDGDEHGDVEYAITHTEWLATRQ